jgi:hypothetical protein
MKTWIIAFKFQDEIQLIRCESSDMTLDLATKVLTKWIESLDPPAPAEEILQHEVSKVEYFPLDTLDLIELP